MSKNNDSKALLGNKIAEKRKSVGRCIICGRLNAMADTKEIDYQGHKVRICKNHHVDGDNNGG